MKSGAAILRERLTHGNNLASLRMAVSLRADLIIKSKSLTGSTDLTLLAPLKRGLVPSLDALTYKSRAQRLLMLLNGGRASSHEYSMRRPISDSVERVARIHSFHGRLTISRRVQPDEGPAR